MSGSLTPCRLKLKRPPIAKAHKDIIDELYESVKQREDRDGRNKSRL